MKKAGVEVPGFNLKDGKLVKGKTGTRKMSVSARIGQRNSKRVRVVRKTAS